MHRHNTSMVVISSLKAGNIGSVLACVLGGGGVFYISCWGEELHSISCIGGGGVHFITVEQIQGLLTS